MVVHGAPIDDTANNYNATALGRALWAAERSDRLEYVWTVAALFAGGADASAWPMPVPTR